MKKKTMIKSFLIAGIAAASIGAFAANNSVQADAATTFAMQGGASVRLTEGSTGIRFTAHVDEVEQNAKYGVIIAPTAYFMNNGEYVTGNYHAHLNAKYNVKDGDVVTDLGYIDLASKPTEVTDSTSEYYGKYAIKGSVGQMNFENMNLSFTGIAYKEVDGVYTYATFENFEDISRSVTNVSSRATQDAQYETKYTPAQQTIIENFLVDGIAEAAGATKSEATYTYNETQYDVEGLMAAIQPTVTITGVEDTLSFLRKAEVTATFSVAGADLNYVWSASNALQVTGNTVQAINIGEGSVSVKAGPFMATETVTIPEPTDMSEAGYVIADMDNGNALSATIQGFDVSKAEAVYDATDAEGPADCVDLQYANGKLGAKLTVGEKMIFALATDGNTYMLSGIASDCVIDNATEYAAWANDMGASAYAVLTTNITMDANKQLQSTSKFTGVFNGLNYTVNNPGFFYSIFAKKSVTTAVFKNVTMENLMVKSWSLFGPSTPLPLIDNVHISVVYPDNYKLNDGWNRLLVHCPETPCTIKNSTIRVTVPNSQIDVPFTMWEGTYNENLAGAYTINLENTVITSNGTILMPGEALDGKVYYSSEVNAKFKNSQIFDKDSYEAVDYMVATNNAVTFEIEGTAKNVWVNGAKVAATQELSQLTVPVTAFGSTAILVQKSDNTYYGVKTTVADYVITNQATFKTFRQSATNTYKYAVLANSFTADGTTDLGGAADTQDFAGVLDGLGNTITNGYFAYGWGTWKSRVTGGTIKNITFENMIVGSGEYGIFGDYMEGLTLENVNISAYFKAGKTIGHSWSAFLGAQVTANLVMKNCNFIITVPEVFTETQFAFYQNNDGYYSGSFENVNVVTNAQLACFGEKDYLGKYVDCLNDGKQRISYNNYNVYDRDVLEALNTTNAYAMLTEGKAKATAGMFGATEMPAAADVLKVYVDGVSVSNYTLETDGITVPTTAGQHTVVIMTKSGSYAALLTAATKEIGSADELKTLYTTKAGFGGQYTVLTQDITFAEGAEAFKNEGYATTAGVFDGRGFTVKNCPVDYLQNESSGFVIKNITFDNLTKLTQFARYAYDNSGFLNVNVINTTLSNSVWITSNKNTSFVHVVNCNFNITCADSFKDSAVQLIGEGFYYMLFINNTTVTYTGTLYTFDDMRTETQKYYSSGKGYSVTLTDKDGSIYWADSANAGTVVTA